MAVINPIIGFYVQAALCLVFGMMDILTPLSILEQYKLDVSSFALVDKLLIVCSTQSLGVFTIVWGIILVITAKRGTCDQQATASLINGVVSSFAVLLTLSSVRSWGDLGVPSQGIYFNASLWALVAVLNFLGASFRPVVKLAPLRKPMYWGVLAMIVIFSCYAVATLFAPESLLEAYTGVGLARKSQQLLVALAKYGYAQTFVGIVCHFIGHIVTASSHATYCIGRFMSSVAFGLVLVFATWLAVWTCLNEGGIYDGMVSGQRFNVGLWLVFFLLFLVPLARMDPAIKDSVEKEVEGMYGLLK